MPPWCGRGSALPGEAAPLTVTPPEPTDAAAKRDLGDAPKSVGARAFALERMAGAVPLAWWTERFACDPAALVAAARANEWAAALASGWTRALGVMPNEAWAIALWHFWRSADEKTAAPATAAVMCAATLAAMGPAEAMERIVPLFRGGAAPSLLDQALAALRAPWPEPVGRAYLAAVRHSLADARVFAATLGPTLRIAVHALPAACFADAIAPIDAELPPAPSRALDDFQTLVRIRSELAQEIPS